MERVEDLEGRLNRETSDYRETINELKQEKDDLTRQLSEVEERLSTAINENQQNDRNNSAQNAADLKLQISRIQQQFKEEKQALELNYKRTITQLESDKDMKEGLFHNVQNELQQLQENNIQLTTDLEGARKKFKQAADSLVKKEQEFQKMGEALG